MVVYHPGFAAVCMSHPHALISATRVYTQGSVAVRGLTAQTWLDLTATMYDRKQHVHGVATRECCSECGVTRLFSCVRASCRPVTQNGAGHGQRSTEYDVHPDYPVLRPVVPLTYSLTMKACLRQHAMERPTFDQILELLRDVVKEVARGRYLDGDGRLQVNFPPSPGTLSPADGVY